MALLQTFLEIAWLFLPVGIANSAPTIAAHYNWFQSFARPIDGGLHLGEHRIFGDHKTWRGLLLGVIFGSITTCLQYFVQSFPALEGIVLLPFVSIPNAIVIGAALGFGALAGDAAKSFLKRRANVAPGQPWRPFDQIDSVVGGIIMITPFLKLSFLHIVVSIISFGVIVFCVSSVGVFFHIKKTI